MATGPYLLSIKRGNDVETTEIRSLQQTVEAAMQYVNEDAEFNRDWEWLKEYIRTCLMSRGKVDFGCHDLDILKDAFEDDDDEEEDKKDEGKEEGEGKKKEDAGDEKEEDAEEDAEAKKKAACKIEIPRANVPEHAAMLIEIRVKDD